MSALPLPKPPSTLKLEPAPPSAKPACVSRREAIVGADHHAVGAAGGGVGAGLSHRRRRGCCRHRPKRTRPSGLRRSASCGRAASPRHRPPSLRATASAWPRRHSSASAKPSAPLPPVPPPKALPNTALTNCPAAPAAGLRRRRTGLTRHLAERVGELRAAHVEQRVEAGGRRAAALDKAVDARRRHCVWLPPAPAEAGWCRASSTR